MWVVVGVVVLLVGGPDQTAVTTSSGEAMAGAIQCTARRRLYEGSAREWLVVGVRDRKSVV